jgi:hypothetical protein
MATSPMPSTATIPKTHGHTLRLGAGCCHGGGAAPGGGEPGGVQEPACGYCGGWGCCGGGCGVPWSGPVSAAPTRGVPSLRQNRCESSA